VPRALLAHHRQDSASDVHRPNEAHRQLPLELLWRQLLEVADIKAGRTSMQPNRSTAARTAASASAHDVQLYGPQAFDCPTALTTASVSRPVATTA
jgi:hypothetical protein